MNPALQSEHTALVAGLAKQPEAILEHLTPAAMDLIHACMGVSGEAGELLDAVKKARDLQ